MLNYVRLTCVLTLSSIGLPAQTVPAVPTVETTAMVGLAQGQTAQLNLLNPGVQAPALGVICAATVSYYDAAGALLKTSTVTVAPGKSSSVDLSGDADLSIAAGARREIRAQIAIPLIPPPNATGSASAVAAACKLIPTLEIFDSASGRTLVTLGRVVPIADVVATPAAVHN